MNVNGARFHLLLGAADWARCRPSTTPASPGGGEGLPPPPLPAWDAQRQDLGLPALATELPATAGERPLTLQARRAAAADRHGNVYRIGDDWGTLWVQAAHDSGRGGVGGAQGGSVAPSGSLAASFAASTTTSASGFAAAAPTAAAATESRFWPPAPEHLVCAEDHGERADFVPLPLSGAAPLGAQAVAAAMLAAQAVPVQETYSALTVTDDDHLVVAFQRVIGPAGGSARVGGMGGSGAGGTDSGSAAGNGPVQRGLLSFDLLTGGPPHETRWPAGTRAPEAWALCARRGGGLWLLDRTHGRLWELDRTLAVITTGQPLQAPEPARADAFAPLDGPARAIGTPPFPAGLDLAWALAAHATAADPTPEPLQDPIAISPETHPAPGTGSTTGALLLLDRDTAGPRCRVWRLQRHGSRWQVQATAWLDGLLAQDLVHAHAAAWVQGAAPAATLFITDSRGNQALPHLWQAGADGVALHRLPELYPLRRHGGRALLTVAGQAVYDSAPDNGPAGTADGAVRWSAVVQQPRQRWEPLAELVTPVFDSQDIGTVWDKLLLDAQVPAGTAVQVDSRAGDDLQRADAAFPVVSPASPATALADGSGDWPGDVLGVWQAEPPPRLRSDGPELPWLRHTAARATRRDTGTGTWELLLQRAQGRYLQLRLRLLSPQGSGTPRLRALRVWQPRFSYPQRFLPAVYRQDPVHGPFLERWLANFESTLTGIEDRIASVQTLLDARSVPADTLPWLASWFEVALDPAWDERRQRLFVRHAMDFFRWRGTVHGLRLALELAFDPCFDAAAFAGPRPQDGGARRIRIVEAYQTRLLGAVAAGDPGQAASGPQSVAVGARWSPAEGNAGLADRLARWRDPQAGGAPPAAQIAPVPLQAPPGMAHADWQAFCSATLGFVPGLGALERARWRDFLAARHGSLAALNAVHGTAWAQWDDVALPTGLPHPVQPAGSVSATGATASNGTVLVAAGGAQNAVTARTATAAPTSAHTAATDWPDHLQQTPDLQRQRWQAFLAGRYRRADRLRAAHGTHWSAFDQVPLPDQLPATAAAQTDWLQFEGALLAMHRTAHRFSVLLPVAGVGLQDLAAQQALAQRIVALEKPAHTTFDVRFYWAFNRVGEARLGLDTQLGAGSRAPELIPDAVVGRAYVGAAFVAGTRPPGAGDRLPLAC